MVGTSLLASLMWIEDPGALSSGNSRLLMIFVGLLAVSMLVQVIIVAAVAVGLAKTQKKLLGIVEQLHGKAMPLMQSAQEAVKDVVPKVKIITENLVETSHMVRAKAHDFDVTLTDANLKTKAQVARVDSLMTTTLTRTAALADTIHNGIRVPVKQAAGVVSGLKVGLDVLLSKSKHPNGRNGSL